MYIVCIDSFLQVVAMGALSSLVGHSRNVASLNELRVAAISLTRTALIMPFTYALFPKLGESEQSYGHILLNWIPQDFKLIHTPQ